MDDQPLKLLLFGNAILDIGKRLQDDSIHRKYKLKLDDQLELESDMMAALKKDLDEVEGISHVASGGSCLNTCKILGQLGEQRSLFCGAIGTDENGAVLEELLDRNNIRRCLQRMANYSTALCICLIYKESRCLVANIAASLHFDSIETVDRIATAAASNSRGILCYIEGYFIPEKMQICKHIWERIVCPGDGRLVLNLNATYIVQGHPGDVLWLFERAHLVFGNRREFEQLLSVTDYATIVDLLRGVGRTDGERICVVTDGANRVQYFRQTNNDISSAWMVVPKVEANLVVDSTGAGDAFVAGFLHEYLRRPQEVADNGEWLTECIGAGVKVARRKLSFLGCSIKSDDDDKRGE